MALTDKLALCTLADVKDDLGITDSASDARLERRILAASDLMLRYIGRPLRREVGRVEKLPGFGTMFLLPKLTPIESVTSIAYDGDLIPADSYEINSDAWGIYAATGWRNTAAALQTMSAELELVPGTERAAFEVTYTGGYWLPNDTAQVGTALPASLIEAAISFTVTLYRAKGRDEAVQAESLGEASVQFAGGVAGRDLIPAGVRTVLDLFRRVA